MGVARFGCGVQSGQRALLRRGVDHAALVGDPRLDREDVALGARVEDAGRQRRARRRAAALEVEAHRRDAARGGAQLLPLAALEAAVAERREHQRDREREREEDHVELWVVGDGVNDQLADVVVAALVVAAMVVAVVVAAHGGTE